MKALILGALLLTTSPILAQDAAIGDTTIAGTMVHTNLEGGCWYLDAGEGKHYELIGDEGVVNSLHSDGKMVQVRVRPAKGVSSTCMVGPIMQVVEDVTPQLHPTDLVMTTMHIEGTVHRAGKTWYVTTKEGLRYDFKELPPKKYRKVGRHYNHTDRVVINPGHKTVSGWILGAPKTPANEARQKPQPATY